MRCYQQQKFTSSPNPRHIQATLQNRTIFPQLQNLPRNTPDVSLDKEKDTRPFSTLLYLLYITQLPSVALEAKKYPTIRKSNKNCIDKNADKPHQARPKRILSDFKNTRKCNGNTPGASPERSTGSHPDRINRTLHVIK